MQDSGSFDPKELAFLRHPKGWLFFCYNMAMEIWHAIVYGVVEGITEFLPVSSTGHLMLVTHLIGNESAFIKSFEIAIQLGAILAVVFLYPKRLLTNKATVIRVASAFIPTAVLGLLFYKIIKHYLMESTAIVLISLFVGGIIIVLIERHWNSKTSPTGNIADLSLRQSALLGVIQCIAFIPGVSRSAATIFGGMFLGLSRKEAVEFSFFLAVPTMSAATVLDIYKNYQTFTSDNTTFLVVGFVTSFVVAILAVRWLIQFVGKHDFTSFGFYRIGIATLGFLLFFTHFL